MLPGDAPVSTSSPLTPAQSWLVSSVLCAQRSLTGRSMGCWRLCQESEDRQDFDFTRLVLRQQLSCWTQTVQKNQPALCHRCCWPWILCQPTKTSGLTDLPASLGTTSIQTWRRHTTDTAKLLGRPLSGDTTPGASFP